jgi:hypothetical protein
MLGIFAIDPGQSTGIAMLVVDSSGGLTVAERVASCVVRESMEVVLDVDDGSAAELNAAVEIARLWQQFEFDCGMSAEHDPCAVVMVCESWSPRLPMKSAERNVLYPVRIAACLEGLLYKRVNGGVQYQSPSQAKRFATDERLRRWGLWVKGSDHVRDAFRHACCWMATNL